MVNGCQFRHTASATMSTFWSTDGNLVSCPGFSNKKLPDNQIIFGMTLACFQTSAIWAGAIVAKDPAANVLAFSWINFSATADYTTAYQSLWMTDGAGEPSSTVACNGGSAKTQW